MPVRFSAVLSCVLICICFQPSFFCPAQSFALEADISSTPLATVRNVDVNLQPHGLFAPTGMPLMLVSDEYG